jgi:hypothetical protein
VVEVNLNRLHSPSKSNAKENHENLTQHIRCMDWAYSCISSERENRKLMLRLSAWYTVFVLHITDLVIDYLGYYVGFNKMHFNLLFCD